MEFKKLEIEQEGSWIKRAINQPHFKKSAIYILVGAIIGFGYYYITEGQHMETMALGEIAQSMFVGAFLGFFITNSPCARGRC